MLAVPEDGNAVAAIVKLIGKEIPSIDVDGIAAAELEYGEYRRRGSRRPGGSDLMRRTRSRDGGPGPAPVEGRAPRRDRQPKLPQPGDLDKIGSNVTAFPRADAVGRPRPAQRKPEQDRHPVVGFGDHLPAFLARPPRVVARP